MNTKKSFVGIMVSNRKQRKYVLKQYLHHNSAHMKLFCFTPSEINWNQKSIMGLHRANQKWVLSRFSFPNVVYNRCYGTDHEVVERLGAMIGINKCFNHINQFNKHEIHKKLNVWLFEHLPETVLYSRENVIHLLEAHKVLFFKPFFGHKGVGVYRAELKDSGEIHIGHHYFSPEIVAGDALQFQESMHKLLGSTPYIIQQGVNIRQWKGQVFDIRALVQKNEMGTWSVTNLASRIAEKGCYNTSIYKQVSLSKEVLKHLYPPDKVNAIIRSVYDISLRTAEIIDTNTIYHLGEFSVDLALDNDAHLWIIELNGKPQKDLYAGIRNQYAVYKRPIQYAHYLCKH